jgi:hypothetical protein
MRVSEYPRWMQKFEGADVILHLAVDQRPTRRDRQLLFDNVEMTLNVTRSSGAPSCLPRGVCQLQLGSQRNRT